MHCNCGNANPRIVAAHTSNATVVNYQIISKLKYNYFLTNQSFSRSFPRIASSMTPMLTWPEPKRGAKTFDRNGR